MSDSYPIASLQAVFGDVVRYRRQRQQSLEKLADLLGGHINPAGQLVIPDARYEQLLASAATTPSHHVAAALGVPIVTETMDAQNAEAARRERRQQHRVHFWPEAVRRPGPLEWSPEDEIRFEF